MTDVRPILARYPQVRGNPRITPVVGGGFSGAGIFQVQSDGVLLCLRRWPELRPPIERLRELHRFLAFVHDRGVTVVAVPFASRDGSTLIEDGGQLWQLEPWKPGKADFLKRPTDERLRTAMHALARLHHAAAQYAPTESGKEWFYQSLAGPAPAVLERIGILREWTASRMHVALSTNRILRLGELPEEFCRHYTWAAPTIERELTAFARTEFRLHPCLRDVWHDHVLFQGAQVSGIIDASAARTENVASDLSRLLGSYLDDDRERWELALNAYAEVRPLAENERRLVRLLDRSGVLLSGLAWVKRCEAMGITAASPGAVAEVQRLRSILGRLRTLADSIDRI